MITQLVLGEFTQGESRHVCRGRREGDHHDLARDGNRGGDFWFNAGRQGFAHLPEALEDAIARDVGIGRPVEVDPHEGESAAGTRADALDAGESVHGGFDRNRDALFDLFRGESARFRLDRHARDLDIRKDVDCEILKDKIATKNRAEGKHERETRSVDDQLEESVEHLTSLLVVSARVKFPVRMEVSRRALLLSADRQRLSKFIEALHDDFGVGFET